MTFILHPFSFILFYARLPPRRFGEPAIDNLAMTDGARRVSFAFTNQMLLDKE
jgi:hypothetical protein